MTPMTRAPDSVKVRAACLIGWKRVRSGQHMIMTESTSEARVMTSPTIPNGGESITTRS
ncbi:MAG: hypothetical protein BWX70_03547 [Verrucomicrobia bacterium ADurb.Bin070]|nr:MAG: hypothetical protein BWX70_03547 [Verrucomicrobia bacterium ADurb.Bin070]